MEVMVTMVMMALGVGVEEVVEVEEVAEVEAEVVTGPMERKKPKRRSPFLIAKVFPFKSINFPLTSSPSPKGSKVSKKGRKNDFQDEDVAEGKGAGKDGAPMRGGGGKKGSIGNSMEEPARAKGKSPKKYLHKKPKGSKSKEDSEKYKEVHGHNQFPGKLKGKNEKSIRGEKPKVVRSKITKSGKHTGEGSKPKQKNNVKKIHRWKSLLAKPNSKPPKGSSNKGSPNVVMAKKGKDEGMGSGASAAPEKAQSEDAVRELKEQRRYVLWRKITGRKKRRRRRKRRRK